jgi:hypothetical protein
MKYSVTADGTLVWGIDLKKRIPDLFTLRTHEPVTNEMLMEIILASPLSGWQEYMSMFKTILFQAKLSYEHLSDTELVDIRGMMIEVFE